MVVTLLLQGVKQKNDQDLASVGDQVPKNKCDIASEGQHTNK